MMPDGAMYAVEQIKKRDARIRELESKLYAQSKQLSIFADENSALIQQRDEARREAAEAQALIEPKTAAEWANFRQKVAEYIRSQIVPSAIDAAVAPYKADAERYRFIRDERYDCGRGCYDTDDEFNAAIDAARGAR